MKMPDKQLRIIVLENDPTLARLLQLSLENKGHLVDIFNNPEACPIFKTHEKECPQDDPCADVIITDLMMPNISGIDFLSTQRLRGCKAPDANKAIISGAAITEEQQNAIDELGCKFFKKPFRLIELVQWVDECAERVS